MKTQYVSQNTPLRPPWIRPWHEVNSLPTWPFSDQPYIEKCGLGMVSFNHPLAPCIGYYVDMTVLVERHALIRLWLVYSLSSRDRRGHLGWMKAPPLLLQICNCWAFRMPHSAYRIPHKDWLAARIRLCPYAERQYRSSASIVSLTLEPSEEHTQCRNWIPSAATELFYAISQYLQRVFGITAKRP
jgi:hypothetical protein